uniref:Uncharacterized protein n=1 Tax=Ciona intestinalis TaxID=7719 RepID=H2XXE9_CIOIN
MLYLNSQNIYMLGFGYKFKTKAICHKRKCALLRIKKKHKNVP